ncbi:MAG: hypothetical protein V1860_00420 [bacterium]
MPLISIEKSLEVWKTVWDIVGKLVENADNIAREQEADIEKRIQIQNLSDRLKRDLTELGEIYEEFEI